MTDTIDHRVTSHDTIEAAGGVVLREGARGTELAIIHRPKYDDWSIPKGKVDPGETLEQTAVREVHEETALRCRIERPLPTQHYPGKVVHYWVMSVEEVEDFVPGEEVDRLVWVPLAEATNELTHAQDRALVASVLERA